MGPEPFALNLSRATMVNDNFRFALWTGEYLQLTLMSIPAYGEIGLERHDDHDQFLRIESGSGEVLMGAEENKLNYRTKFSSGYGIFIPAGIWHNIVNTSSRPVKIYSIYAPPEHPHGTIHQTKEIADEAEMEGYQQ